VIRLVGALLVEINDEMIAAERRYIAAALVADLILIGCPRSPAHLAERRSTGRSVAQEIPPVPLDIPEHRHPPIRLVSRFGDELDPGGEHSLMGGVEVVHSEEEPNPSSVLGTDRGPLVTALGPRQQQPGRRFGRSHHHPSFRAAVVGSSGRVLHELELQLVDEEADGLVVVTDDQADQLQVHASRWLTE